MPDSPPPLTPDERAELARLAAHIRNTAVYTNHEEAADGIDRLLAHLARVEGEREEARTERDEARAMFGEAHERQKRAEADCDAARAQGRAEERAAVVAWLRDSDDDHPWRGHRERLADTIERGAHLPPETTR